MTDPIRAVTMEHPGEIYAPLAETEALTWSDCYRLWVAAHPNVVREVLEHPDCAVRSRDARVPSALVGTRAGQIFGLLARMTEGEHHDRTKQAISHALVAIAPDSVRSAACRAAAIALDGNEGARFTYDCSQLTLLHLFGVPEVHLAEMAAHSESFARCLAPDADDATITNGINAADTLWQRMSELAGAIAPGPLTDSLQRAFTREGLSRDALIANMIGLLFQAYDAVAGLIGNTVVHLAQGNGAGETQLRAYVTEVSHVDPSIQNTRRFVERDTVIAGQPMSEGDVILVVLAVDGSSCPFGHGRHACRGQEIAVSIAEQAVREVVRRAEIATSVGHRVTYRSSVNARIPELDFVPGRRSNT